MVILNVFFDVLLPILVMFGCGWVLDRKTPLDLNTLVKLNLRIFVPAFMFYQVVTAKVSASEVLRVVLFTACISGTLFFIAAWVAKAQGMDMAKTRSLQIAAMFYNSANYGIPLMTLAYPLGGVSLQAFVIMTQNIGNFTVGLALAASARHTGWRAILPMLRQGSIWALFAGLMVRAFGIPVMNWPWLWVPVDFIHKGLVSFALLTLGVQLSKTKVHPAFSRLGWALGLRLIGGPIVGAALVWIFGFRGETAAQMILSASFPTAVNTALIAHEFNADPEFATSAVFWSTICSMATVTLLIALLRLPAVLQLLG